MTWRIDHHVGNLVIYGPGQLEIILHDFDAVKASEGWELPDRLVGTLVERHWRYPLEGGVWLEGISIQNTADMLGRPPTHFLYIGRAVRWHLPRDTAEELHRLMGEVGEKEA